MKLHLLSKNLLLSFLFTCRLHLLYFLFSLLSFFLSVYAINSPTFSQPIFNNSDFSTQIICHNQVKCVIFLSHYIPLKTERKKERLSAVRKENFFSVFVIPLKQKEQKKQKRLCLTSLLSKNWPISH